MAVVSPPPMTAGEQGAAQEAEAAHRGPAAAEAHGAPAPPLAAPPSYPPLVPPSPHLPKPPRLRPALIVVHIRRIAASVYSVPVSAPQVYLGAAVLADIMKDKPDFWISKQEWCGQAAVRVVLCCRVVSCCGVPLPRHICTADSTTLTAVLCCRCLCGRFCTQGGGGAEDPGAEVRGHLRANEGAWGERRGVAFVWSGRKARRLGGAFQQLAGQTRLS